MSKLISPWTQSLTLAFRPELSFFERRYEILRRLEEDASMWAFRTSEGRASARLIDQWHQLSIAQDRTSMHLLSPTADEEALWEAFSLAVKMIHPRISRSMAAAFQFVEPLEMSATAAIACGHRQSFIGVEAAGIRGTDWAVLLDLEVDGIQNVHGQTEFGIVEHDEVPARLSRRAGRTNYGETPDIPHELWAREQFPAVALFADVTFYSDRADGLAGVRPFWEGVRDRAGTLVEALKARLTADDRNEEVAS